MELLLNLAPLLIIIAIPTLIYFFVKGKKTKKLQKIGWLELLITCLLIFFPMGQLMAFNALQDVFDRFPDLEYLSMIDSIFRIIIIFWSIYAGVCMWKVSPGAVIKAKIFLIVFFVFQVVIVRLLYNFIFYSEMASKNIILPANSILHAYSSDILGFLASLLVIGSWYIYLNKSKRIKEIYGISSDSSVKAMQSI